MLNIFIIALCLIPIVYYIFKLRDFKLNTKTMVIIALFAGVHFCLSKIQFIQYPQGGGIDLLSSLPILMVGILYGPTIGMTCGLVSGLIILLGEQLFIVHPAQFLLDYILPTILLGLSGICGSEKKSKIFLGCLIVLVFKVTVHVISGCVYFYEYAPVGWSPLAYSLVYNLTGEGIEVLLSSVVITIIPIVKIMKMANINTVNKCKGEYYGKNK